MKYLLIETDKKNHIPYSINSNRAVDIRYANRQDAHKIPDCCIVSMKTPMEVFFPDILTEPFLMVSDTVADVMEMYAPDTSFKTIYLLEKETRMYQTYFMPFLEEVDCLSERTRRSRGGTELLEIVLRGEAVRRKPVFRIAGFTHVYLVCDMEFIESALRRDIRGIRLKEIEVENE